MALQKFAQKFEFAKGASVTKVALEQSANVMSSQSFSWPGSTASAEIKLNHVHVGSGTPWITVQSLAAAALKQSFSSGYRINKTIVPVEQKEKGKYTRGDILRIDLEVDAQIYMT